MAKIFLLLYFRQRFKENYTKPIASIVIRGNKSISRLNNFLIELDKENDLFNDKNFVSDKTYAPTFINLIEPILMAYIKNGSLYLMEADDHSKLAYKPAKQLVLEYDELKDLYDFLHYVFGSPIHLQKRFGKQRQPKKTEELKPEEVSSGWDLIK
jgi:hypothetical protein